MKVTTSAKFLSINYMGMFIFCNWELKIVISPHILFRYKGKIFVNNLIIR